MDLNTHVFLRELGDRVVKALDECADALRRSERLLERALALRDGLKPNPVQPCGAQGYTREDHPMRYQCDLGIAHRGNHATGGVFWRLTGFSKDTAVCAAQQPGHRGDNHLFHCEEPALHSGPHHFKDSDMEGRW